MFAQNPRVLIPLPPLACPCSFSSSYVCFDQNSPSPPQFLYLWNLEKGNKELNNECWYLWFNSTCLLRSRSGISIKVNTIVAWQKCLFYGDVRFIESPSKNQKSSKVNMKSTICHDFPNPDLLEGSKYGKIKKKCKVLFFLKSSNKVHYISTINYWSPSTHFL